MKNLTILICCIFLTGCVTFGKPKPMSLEDVRALSQQSLDAKTSALSANTTPALADGLYWIDDIDGTPVSNKILWGTLLNDAKGNGDVAYIWSANKTFDQLALKENALTDEASLYSTLSDVTQFYEAGDEATILDVAGSITSGDTYTNFGDAAATIIHVDVTTGSGGATNTMLLFGILY